MVVTCLVCLLRARHAQYTDLIYFSCELFCSLIKLDRKRKIILSVKSETKK